MSTSLGMYPKMDKWKIKMMMMMMMMMMNSNGTNHPKTNLVFSASTVHMDGLSLHCKTVHL